MICNSIKEKLIFRTSSENLISYWWLKEIYSQLPYNYRKNLKGLINASRTTSNLWNQQKFISCGEQSNQNIFQSVLHCPSVPVDPGDYLVVFHFPCASHQTQDSQHSRGSIRYLGYLLRRKKSIVFQVKELDSVINSTEFDIPMFIQVQIPTSLKWIEWMKSGNFN